MKKITVDGNSAVARIAYSLSECASVYPITPSSSMAEVCSKWADEGKLNIFGDTLNVIEMQSEAGASGAVHGSAIEGALSTTFTASQGLLLMIPNMYKLAGELLPCVFHVSARALATHALSIFGDHSDVMATRQTGFCMLCSSNVQESLDMALASHIATVKASVPFLHFFDGFRTSHEIQKICDIDDENIKSIFPYEKLKEYKQKALDPNHPVQKGTAQNPDIFFQNREACNTAYNKVYDIVCDTFADIEKITGRSYAPFEYYGDKNAESIIVIMGSGSETASETIDYLNKNGYKVGMIKVRLYRPFNSDAFVKLIPSSVKNIAVLDRTKEQTAIGEPLYEDVISSLYKANKNLFVLGGRYGLGSKEFTPSDVKAVFDNLKTTKINSFTVGIDDDVTNKSLKTEELNIVNDGFEFKFFGLGSDGTVGANKNSIKIIGENTDFYVQGYFDYDSKKSGSLTTSHLRVSPNPIRSTYRIQSADLIAIHNFSFISRYNVLDGLKQNGIVLLNTVLNEEGLNKFLPNNFKQVLKEKNAKFYIINAEEIARNCGLNNKINTVMQTAFFKLCQVVDYSIVKQSMVDAIKKTYGKKGDEVVNNNISALENAESKLKQVDFSNFTLNDETKPSYLSKDYYSEFIAKIERLEGDKLPVSSFDASGTVPTDTAKYLKRGIALNLPCWNSDNCIQCGMCALACPHSAIRGGLFKEENLKDAPSTFNTKNALATNGLKYRLQISPLDCTGCGVCSQVCPARNKALVMKQATEVIDIEKPNYDFFINSVREPNSFGDTPKGLQFNKPYFEYCGACAGCGETPYIKLATNLFGKNMIIANATGCSSIYGGNSPVCPYTKDSEGNGPAWANSLFEDNAEFGLGIKLASEQKKKSLVNLCKDYLKISTNEEINNILNTFINNLSITKDEKQKVMEVLTTQNNELASKILEQADSFEKKSIWIIGGDGWAYDIGFGGLDHVLSSGENVTILVLDSEVYSNTGGQASKSTQRSAIASFTTKGKRLRKKDLGMQAIMHKDCYVASISLGANQMQAIKAFKEAESYNGVSIILAYSPCINHGLDMSKSNLEMKRAVESGYWTLYRYNPSLEQKLTIDSPEPTLDYKEFLLGETRYKSLLKINPDKAEQLYEQSKQDAEERRNDLKKLL